MHGASAATPPLSSCPHENAPLRTDCGRVQQCAPPKCLLLQPALCPCLSVRGTVQLMVGPKVSRPAPRAPRMRIDFSYGIKRCIACMDPSIQGQPGPSVVSLHQDIISLTHAYARTHASSSSFSLEPSLPLLSTSTNRTGTRPYLSSSRLGHPSIRYGAFGSKRRLHVRQSAKQHHPPRHSLPALGALHRLRRQAGCAIAIRMPAGQKGY